MAATITVDELLAELTRLGVGREPDAEALTLKELMRQWDLKEHAVQKIIDEAIQAGLCKPVKTLKADKFGDKRLTASYKFTLPEKTPAKARK